MIAWILAAAYPFIFNSLNPTSLSQALAFYELYPDSAEGKEALKRINKLLNTETFEQVELLTHSVNRFLTPTTLTLEQIEKIEQLAAHLPNRKLKGYAATSEAEVLQLDPAEIDCGKGLLLSQLEGQKEGLQQVRSYSALLDLMALQLTPRLSAQSTPEEKIKVLNQFIFEESRFRFPPHSLYAKDIDLYTFLPFVMDNHLGVCLGVTTLYLALADRLGLHLESITPPGHIYLRYREGEKTINIETTARGINLPDEKYLGLNVKQLQVRSKREVIGMTHVNKASIYLHQENFAAAVKCYETAQRYLENDPMVQELLGLSLLFVGEKTRALTLLKEATQIPAREKMLSEKLAEDYLSGKVDEEGLKAIFMQVDEKRSSILAKQKRLQLVVERFPQFRSGLEQLGVGFVQLGRTKEALHYLNEYHKIDSQNPVIEYYLAVLHGEREDFNNSWRFLNNAEKIVETPSKVLLELKKKLLLCSPQPKD